VDSGARGDVKASPVCAVERAPPDPSCAPQGFETVVRVRANGRLVKKVRTDGKGRFKARLRPGTYVLDPRDGANGLPRCESRTVTVKAHRFAKVHLACDTGLR
jgi:hypothetical protein